jgi:hypothetical protein
MPTVEYKVFFDNESATQEQLDKIEEITVEQQINMAWEARLMIPICVNSDGKWEGEEEAWMKPYSRVRVEVRIGEGDFAPLIDGPVVGNDSERSSIPGKSVITLVAHDDSALLHREDEVQRYEAGSDSEIAEQIFSDANLGGSIEIDSTPPHPDNPAAAIIQRGTKMQILRSLARRHRNWHAFVLPGSEPGQSVGCFKKLPEQSDGLPALILFGEDRNTLSINVKHNARSSSDVTAATLSLRDKSVTTSSSSYRDAALLGPQTATDTQGNTTTRRLPPGQSDLVDLDSATSGEAATSGYALEATGEVMPFCYTGVLSPYRVVQAQMSDTLLSGNFVIFKVTHKLTRNIYAQSFTLRGNSVTPAASGSASGPQPSASLSVNFNVQASIF